MNRVPRGLRPLPRLGLWRALLAAALLAIAAGSLLPLPGPVVPVPHGDKLEHFAGYGAVMLGYAALCASYPALLLRAIGLLLWGAAIEVAQSTSGYRHGDWRDLLANAAGIATAAAVGAAALARRRAAAAREPA